MTDPIDDDHGLPYQPRRVSPRPRLVAYSVLMIGIAVALAWCVKAEAHEPGVIPQPRCLIPPGFGA